MKVCTSLEDRLRALREAAQEVGEEAGPALPGATRGHLYQ